MVTDPQATPPPVIAAALEEPLAVAASEATSQPPSRRHTHSSGSSGSSSTGGGGSGTGSSNGRSASPPKAPVPPANDSPDGAADSVRAAPVAAAPIGSAHTVPAPVAPALTPSRPQSAEHRPVDSGPQRPPRGSHDAAAGAARSSAANSTWAAPAMTAAAAAPAAASAVAAIPLSLQDTCCKVILRHISVHNCLELLEALRGRAAPSLDTITAASLRYAISSFETLQGLRSEEQMRAALPEDIYENLTSAHRERLQAVAGMRRLGRAVERQPPPPGAGPSQVASVTGRPVSYPPEALQPGVVWPEGVQAADRETWLVEEDFRLLFKGLGWEEFCRLPGWKKTGMKQAAGMF